jgi:hypothetical protein
MKLGFVSRSLGGACNRDVDFFSTDAKRENVHAEINLVVKQS